MDKVYQIVLENGVSYLGSADESLGIALGNMCVFRKDFYLDYGKLTKRMPLPASGDEAAAAPAPPAPPAQESSDTDGGTFSFGKKNEVYAVLRKVNEEDLAVMKENHNREKNALEMTQQYVNQLNLPMKLINAHYSYDSKLLLIQFSAEGRIDFRELVKLLAREFNTHIELRQIGVRDETAILGGIANCGRPLCCCRFLHDFPSINVKMAKEQDLSLVPTTISGICGRLKCCLKYEHEGYLELEKTMPRRGDLCECKDGRGRVIDRNLLTQKVTIQLDDSTHTLVCPASEVNVVYLDKFKMRKDASDKSTEESDSANSRQTLPQKQFRQKPQNNPNGNKDNVSGQSRLQRASQSQSVSSNASPADNSSGDGRMDKNNNRFGKKFKNAH